MAVRQYIGARYVIKIYENSVDPASAEWESSVNYEPLTMVTYNYGSYLSKKEVPASVGNPADNPTYWVQTGFYNGQIASLQDQIDAINNTTIPAITSDIESLNDDVTSLQGDVTALEDKVDLIQNKKYLIIGDSYAVYNTPNFVDLLAGYLGLTINTDIFVSAASGYGFSNANGKFISLLNSAAIPDDVTITDIIVLGGVNDAFVLTDVESDISAFITRAKELYPDALVHIGMLGGNTNLSIKNALPSVVQEYTKCSKYGACYMTNCEFIMKNHLLITSDGTHPTADGTQFIAQCIANYILNGTIDVIVPDTEVNITSPLTCTIHYAIHNEIETIIIYSLTNLPYNAVYTNEFQSITGTSQFPFNGSGTVTFSGLCTFTSGTTFYVLPIDIRITDTTIEYRIRSESNQTLQNVSEVKVFANMTLDSLMY